MGWVGGGGGRAGPARPPGGGGGRTWGTHTPLCQLSSAHLRDLVLPRLQQQHQLLHSIPRQLPGGRLRCASCIPVL